MGGGLGEGLPRRGIPSPKNLKIVTLHPLQMLLPFTIEENIFGRQHT